MGASGSTKPTQPSNQTTTQQPSALDLSSMSNSQQQAEIRRLQQSMGQTGYEAGDPNTDPKRKLYVNTSKAFNINYYLNTDGASINAPGSQWHYLGYTERMVKNDIARIDSGMRPLSENVQLHRYVDEGGLRRILNDRNLDVNNLIRTIKNDNTALNDFNNVLRNTAYTQKAYSSFSYVKEHSTFDKYLVRFNTVMKAGTPAIVTNNHAEHEILGSRGLKYNFTGARVVSEYSTALRRYVDRLVIDVAI